MKLLLFIVFNNAPLSAKIEINWSLIWVNNYREKWGSEVSAWVVCYICILVFEASERNSRILDATWAISLCMFVCMYVCSSLSFKPLIRYLINLLVYQIWQGVVKILMGFQNRVTKLNMNHAISQSACYDPDKILSFHSHYSCMLVGYDRTLDLAFI